MRISVSVSSLYLVSFCSIAFSIAISSPQWFAHIIIIGLMIVFGDSALAFNRKALFGGGEEELLLQQTLTSQF